MAKQVGFGECSICESFWIVFTCLVTEERHCRTCHESGCMFQEDLGSRADMDAYLAASAAFDPTGSRGE